MVRLSISSLFNESNFFGISQILLRSSSWNIYGIPSDDTWTSVSINLHPKDCEYSNDSSVFSYDSSAPPLWARTSIPS